MAKADCQKHTIIIIGAGPTGLTLAKVLLDNHMSIIMIDANHEGIGGGVRDSIFWDKDKLKLGILKKHAELLNHPRFRYFGGIEVGEDRDVTIEDLQQVAPVILTCGSRGHKQLPIDGADAEGVWDANVLVRILNTRWLLGRTKGPAAEEALERPYVGKKIAMVGMGNVVADTIKHIATLDNREGCGREISVLVRRTPFASKIAPAEMKWILGYIDKSKLETEIKRILPYLIETDLDIPEQKELKADWEKDNASYQHNLEIILKALKIKIDMFNEMPDSLNESQTRVDFKFATQIKKVDQADDKIKGIEITQKLVGDKSSESRLDCDTIIMSVGSSVDEQLGLDHDNGYFVSDGKNDFLLKGENNIFMAGWARQPSVGLAGVATKEGKKAGETLAPLFEAIEDETKSLGSLTETEKMVSDLIVGVAYPDWFNLATARHRLQQEIQGNQVMSFVTVD